MPGAIAAFARDLTAAWRRLEGDPVVVPCGGAPHRLEWRRAGTVALDHDLEAERSLGALGGEPPRCLALIRALETASDAQLWFFLSQPPTFAVAVAGVATSGATLLPLLPEAHRRVLVAERLHVTFRTSSAVVRNSVAKLGLVVLSGSVSDTDVQLKYKMTREFPKWDTGLRPWTDKELVLLHRHLRPTKGEPNPYLTAIPTDTVSRRTIALFLADQLDDHRMLAKRDLVERLTPFHRNVTRLTQLLVAEGALEETADGYRTSLPRTTPTHIAARVRSRK